MPYLHPLAKTLRTLLSRPTPVIHVLTGPRQVGKTTIARQLQKGFRFPVVYATADSPTPLDSAWVETHWRRAVLQARHGRSPVLLILDEVQKVQGWSETLKRLWEDRQGGPDIRVLLLGSSALLMQEGLSESLTGRFFLHRCQHWGYGEVRAAFGWDLDHWLYFGGYPGAVPFAAEEGSAEDARGGHPPSWRPRPTSDLVSVGSWKRYIVDSLIETVLARDVLPMTKIAKPTLLRHLFALAAALPARVVSYTKMLGQLQDAGNTTTLAHYLRLLESAFLASGLELFSWGMQRKRGSSPKLVLWNNALVNALSTRTFDEARREPAWWGRLVENAVGAHLCCGLPPVEYAVSYWRDGPHEVDFVVTRGPDLWALEVKSGRGGRKSGLARFQDRYPKAKVLLIGSTGIPLEEFFGHPPAEWLA